jgi:thioredoxin-like negative regulator of GroEL
VAATQGRGRTGWRAVYEVGGGRFVVVRTETTTGGGAMQEKEVTRTETQSLVENLRQLASDLESGNYGDADKLVTSAADKIDELVAAILHLADRWDEKNRQFQNAEKHLYQTAEELKKLEAENAKLRG